MKKGAFRFRRQGSALLHCFFVTLLLFFTSCDQEKSPPQPTPATSQPGVKKLPTETFRIAGEDFEIELAFRQQTRVQGLMYRKSLGKNEGMFFVFKYSRQQSFHMANCLIDLDILYIQHDGVIANIEIMKAPLPGTRSDNYDSDGPVKYALELSAGTAARLDLKPGQTIDLPARIGRIIPEPDF